MRITDISKQVYAIRGPSLRSSYGGDYARHVDKVGV